MSSLNRKRLSEAGRPLVSIITAVRNAEALLESTIVSMIAQTYDNVEYIIIDGASTDRSLEVIKDYEEAIDIWISEPDHGIYEAWNKGLRVARGEWIGFLGAGDVYYNCAIEKYIGRICEYGQSGLEYISSKNELISEDGVVMRVIGSEWRWKTFRRFMNVAHVGSLHHRTLFHKYGQFDPHYRICGDYELLLRPRASLRAGFLDQISTKMRIAGISHSSQALREAMRAKRTSGGRRGGLCVLEMLIAELKLWIRSAISCAYVKAI